MEAGRRLGRQQRLEQRQVEAVGAHGERDRVGRGRLAADGGGGVLRREREPVRQRALDRERAATASASRPPRSGGPRRSSRDRRRGCRSARFPFDRMARPILPWSRGAAAGPVRWSEPSTRPPIGTRPDARSASRSSACDAEGQVARPVPVEHAVHRDAARAGPERQVVDLHARAEDQARRPLERPVPAALRQREPLELRAHGVPRGGDRSADAGDHLDAVGDVEAQVERDGRVVAARRRELADGELAEGGVSHLQVAGGARGAGCCRAWPRRRG